MSGTFDNQQQNNLPEPDASSPDSPDLTSSTPSPPKPAQPIHQPEPADDSDEVAEPEDTEETLDPLVRSTAATAADLDRFLAGQRGQTSGETPAEPPKTDPALATSAEPDFASYTLPPLEAPPPEPEPESSSWQTTWAIIREVGETIILTLVIFFLIQMVIRNFRVVGTSMVNNLHNGQYLIIDKVSYSPLVNEYLNLGGPSRGDVVVFEPPRRPNEDYVKRVIALPGEKVQVIKGVVYINDEPLEEPFRPRPASYSMPAPVVVPEGHVFVLGDNRNNSNDSHNWGSLPIENIVGRAWISYWPPEQWGTIPRDAPTEEATVRYLLEEFIPSANAQNE